MEINKNIETLKACRFCPMCRHVCTSGNISLHESDYPRGRGLILDSIKEKRMEYTPDLVQSIYNCCLCGLCWSNCEGGYKPHQLALSSRKDIAGAGAAPEAAYSIVERIESGESPYGGRGRIYMGNDRKADILYLMGDLIKFSAHDIADSVEKIMQKAGDKYTILKDEPTDGKIMSLLGFSKKAEEAAKTLSRRLREMSPEVILVSDPLSYDCLKNDFPAYGIKLDAQILHISQYLEKLINKKGIKVKKVEDPATLLDSEFLGRFNGIYDAPRNVIKAVCGKNYREMAKTREYALATGEASFIFNNKRSGMGSMIGSRLCQAASAAHVKVAVVLSVTARKNLEGCSGIEVFEISEFIWQNIK